MTGNFQQALRDELLAAARRSLIPARRPWWRRTRTVVGAVAAAAAGVGVMAVATLGPAAASVTITADGDMVTVTLNDTSNSADEIESAIEDHGLDIDIEEVPVGPSNYGRFVSYTTDQSKHFDEVTTVDENGVTFMTFSVPRRWTGNLTVFLGRPARTGESYYSFSDAYDPGEPLACTGTFGEPLEDLADALDLDELTITVQVFEGGSPRDPVPYRDALEARIGDRPITGGGVIAEGKIIVNVGRPDVSAPPPC